MAAEKSPQMPWIRSKCSAAIAIWRAFKFLAFGDAYSSRKDKKRGLVLVVDLGEDDEVELCQGQVKHIRDITDYGEDSE
mgnify:CR=1 FL=1